MNIKFLTVNIWSGGKLMDNLIAFIKNESPDIIAMQEVYNGHDSHLETRFRTMDYFKEELNFPYSAYAKAYIDIANNRHLPSGNAILSRFPINANEEIYFDVPFQEYDESSSDIFEFTPRVLQYSKIQIENKDLDVFNNHGIWGKNGLDNERRFQMSNTIIQHIKDKQRVILSGDFNMSYETKAIVNIEQYLNNIFKGELTCTFNMKHKTDPGYATAAVDMMFVSPSIKVLDHYCPKVDVSDHLPLIATLAV